MSNQEPPVKAGEELEVTVQAVGEKGDGIARKEGFVLFVPDTKKGERVRIRITKVLQKVGFAEVVERLGMEEKTEKGPMPEELPDVTPENRPKDTDDFGPEED